MCGICGQLRFDGIAPSDAAIARMCEMIEHRGPDDRAIYSDDQVALGETRLAVIDLSHAAVAPMPNEDRSVWAVFNGEIYNFVALRDDLRARGHLFRTQTDTEVLVHAYEEWGVDCVSRFRGMFAFVVWDSRRRMLFGARDRLGKKPLLYSLTAGAFTFASEFAAMRAGLDHTLTPDFGAIDSYLTYQYVPSPLTAYREIRKLAPAHYFIIDVDRRLTLQRYWRPPVVRPERSEEADVVERLLAKLRESVRLRMTADVPVGAFLSGGLDSATVVALMAEVSDRPVKTFTIALDGEAEDLRSEAPYAKLVAEHYATEHHTEVIRPDCAEVLPRLVRHYGEPFADSSAIPTYYVSAVARRQVTVALSGDGGDENLAGYDAYGDVARWSAVDSLPRALRVLIQRAGTSALMPVRRSNWAARAERGLAMLAGDVRKRYGLHVSVLKPQEKQWCYTSKLWDALQHDGESKDALAQDSDDDDAIAWMMRHDQQHYLPDCLMVKVDIASMANSLEVRAPFLDHELVELCAAIPTEMKRSNGTGKLILRKAVAPLLPAPLFDRPKTGFGVPLARWLRTELAGLLRANLMDDTFRRRGLLDHNAVRSMIDDHLTGRRDWSNRLWAFLFLEMWFREFVD